MTTRRKRTTSPTIMEPSLSEFLEQDDSSVLEVSSIEDDESVEAALEELPVSEPTEPAEVAEEPTPEPTLDATPEPVKLTPEPVKPVTRPRPPAPGKPLTPRNISRFSPYRQ